MPWERIFENWPIYKTYENDAELQDLYRQISLPENIEKMIDYNERKKPPIVGLIKTIEDWNERAIAAGLDIKKEKRLRRLIGLMIGEILQDYGYRPGKVKNVSHCGAGIFLSASCYDYIKEAAVKKLQKEIAIESSVRRSVETPKKGRCVATEEFVDTLKNFKRFWKKYALSEKVRSIFLSLDLRKENQAHHNSSMANYLIAVEFKAFVFPFAEELARYSSGMFLTVFQIASLLEGRYPGIIELSGVPTTITREISSDKRVPDFYNVFSEVLLEDANDESSVFEAAYMSGNYMRFMSFFVEEMTERQDLENTEIPMFRLRENNDVLKDIVLKERFGSYSNEISEEFFKKFDVMNNIINLLKKDTGTKNGDKLVYYNLFQVVAGLSHRKPLEHYGYPLACVFFELMKRIFKGEVTGLKLDIWPGVGLLELTYSIELRNLWKVIDG
ncbi:MAG TPA: hypothetical protein PK467_06395, partial [Candidatus Wallbacteria bacterium]|nr:hypothetical protein [Candidatus Wallbacteria bacterium]